MTVSSLMKESGIYYQCSLHQRYHVSPLTCFLVIPKHPYFILPQTAFSFIHFLHQIGFHNHPFCKILIKQYCFCLNLCELTVLPVSLVIFLLSCIYSLLFFFCLNYYPSVSTSSVQILQDLKRSVYMSFLTTPHICLNVTHWGIFLLLRANVMIQVIHGTLVPSFLLRISMCVSVVCGCVHVFLVYLSLWQDLSDLPFPSVGDVLYDSSILYFQFSGTWYNLLRKQIYGPHYFFPLYSESDCVHKLELGDWNLFPLILTAIFHRKGISLVTNVDHLYVSHLFCCTSCVTEIR